MKVQYLEIVTRDVDGVVAAYAFRWSGSSTSCWPGAWIR